MIFHVHFSPSIDSGEIRRIRNINEEFAAKLSPDVLEIAFLSIPHCFLRSSKGFTLSEKVCKKLVIPTFPFRYKLLFFRWLNSIWMSLCLRFLALIYKPSHVVVEFSTGWEVLRFIGGSARIIIDAHGASAAEYEYSNLSPKKCMSYYLLHTEIEGLRRADYYICQSEAMKSYLGRVCGKKYEKKITVFQCNASPSCFRYDSKARAEMRKLLGVSDGEHVLIYSGGLHKWQMIRESISMFLQYKRCNSNCKMLILTRESEAARCVIHDVCGSERDDILVLSSTYDQVYKYLNAADAGIVLRENVLLNQVASPTKLGEYIMTGLPVISNSVAKHWMRDDRFLFNLDTEEISSLHNFIDASNREEVAEYGVCYHSLQLDINNIAKLIDDCK